MMFFKLFFKWAVTFFMGWIVMLVSGAILADLGVNTLSYLSSVLVVYILDVFSARLAMNGNAAIAAEKKLQAALTKTRARRLAIKK